MCWEKIGREEDDNNFSMQCAFTVLLFLSLEGNSQRYSSSSGSLHVLIPLYLPSHLAVFASLLLRLWSALCSTHSETRPAAELGPGPDAETLVNYGAERGCTRVITDSPDSLLLIARISTQVTLSCSAREGMFSPVSFLIVCLWARFKQQQDSWAWNSVKRCGICYGRKRFFHFL